MNVKLAILVKGYEVYLEDRGGYCQSIRYVHSNVHL